MIVHWTLKLRRCGLIRKRTKDFCMKSTMQRPRSHPHKRHKIYVWFCTKMLSFNEVVVPKNKERCGKISMIHLLSSYDGNSEWSEKRYSMSSSCHSYWRYGWNLWRVWWIARGYFLTIFQWKIGRHVHFCWLRLATSWHSRSTPSNYDTNNYRQLNLKRPSMFLIFEHPMHHRCIACNTKDLPQGGMSWKSRWYDPCFSLEAWSCSSDEWSHSWFEQKNLPISPRQIPSFLLTSLIL